MPKKPPAALREVPARRLHRALAVAGDGVFVTGRDGGIVLWNAAAERILGHTADDVIGRRCCEVLAGRDEHGNRFCRPGCNVRALVKLGEPIHDYDMQTRTKAGGTVWLNLSVLSMPPLTVHLFRDTTARRRFFDALAARGIARPAPDAERPRRTNHVLTRRELEIVGLLAAGSSTVGMARQLRVSRATVRNHIQNVFAKLGVHSRVEAVAFATRHGWL